jgi:hypothetical protein
MHVVVAEILAGPAEIAAAAASEGCADQQQCESRSWPNSGGPDRKAPRRHFNRPMSGTPTATAAGCCTLFRSMPTAGLVGLAFDPDNRKDQHGPHAIAHGATHCRARPPRSRIRREFNDGAHLPRSLSLPRGRDLAGDMPIKNSTWLTAS